MEMSYRLMMKKLLPLKDIPNSRLVCTNHTLFQTKMVKIDTLFQTKTAEKILYTRADKCWAVKRALRSSFIV